jgi:hypothetical protein
MVKTSSPWKEKERRASEKTLNEHLHNNQKISEPVAEPLIWKGLERRESSKAVPSVSPTFHFNNTRLANDISGSDFRDSVTNSNASPNPSPSPLKNSRQTLDISPIGNLSPQKQAISPCEVELLSTLNLKLIKCKDASLEVWPPSRKSSFNKKLKEP